MLPSLARENKNKWKRDERKGFPIEAPQIYDGEELSEEAKESLSVLHDDFEVFSKECLKIKTKDGRMVSFELNEPQKKVHEMVERQLLETGKIRAIILKARREGVCLDPLTKVLTADLRWIEIDKIVPGDVLFATDEFPLEGQGNSRKLRKATVLIKREVYEQAFRITLEDGTVIIATGQHRFLSLYKRTKTYFKTPVWLEVNDMKVGDCLRRVVKPWPEPTFEDGWMGGLIDGEGCISGMNRMGRGRGCILSISQKPGRVLDRAFEYLKSYCVHRSHEKIPHLVVCNIEEVLGIVGRTRPSRFIMGEWWDGKWLSHKSPWVKIRSIEPLNTQRMIDLQTSTKTFIAEGFVSHNSTYVQGRLFHRGVMNPYITSLTAAHDAKSSLNIFEMNKTFYNHMPEALRPSKEYSTRQELTFNTSEGQGLNSKLMVDTAGNVTLGRSFTLQVFHASEVAFWDNAHDVMLAVKSAVGDVPGSMIFLESTANGVGGWFYDEWNRAIMGKSEFIPIFLPWFIFDEYRKLPTVDFKLTSEEEAIAHKFKLNIDQMCWRRWAIENLADGDLSKFRQEYPATPEEAFIVSGNPVFNVEILAEMIKDAEPPGITCNLTLDPNLSDFHEDLKPKLEPTRNGYVRIWRAPNRFHRYVIGADVASGVKDGDYSTGQVLDRNTWQVVAEWHGRIDPDLFGEELRKLAMLYNRAFIGCEVNKDGLTVNRYLRDNYGDVYQRFSYDRTQDITVQKVGWLTNSQTKPIMINDLARMIRRKEVKLYNLDLLNELFRYIRDEKGEACASEGSFDDRVIALAIALQMATIITEYDQTKHKVRTMADMIQDDIAAYQKSHSDIEDEVFTEEF